MLDTIDLTLSLEKKYRILLKYQVAVHSWATRYMYNNDLWSWCLRDGMLAEKAGRSNG